MNTQHLKYAVEVERTGSISKAAENLYMNQPHLSKTIRELEESLGIVIFKRTTKGVVPTKQGAAFLVHAKKILSQVKELESLYKPDTDGTVKFDIAVPRASYISHAFTEFARAMCGGEAFSFNYRETNSIATIKNVADGENNMGIVRYQNAHEPYYMNMIKEKGLKFETILSFSYLALMSRNHPLARKERIDLSEFSKYIQITHGDSFVISIPTGGWADAPIGSEKRREIAVYERGSQFELLRRIETSYMWVSPVPDEVLKTFSLVQRSCPSANNLHKDILIYRDDYVFSDADKSFIAKLREVAQSAKEQDSGSI